MTPAIEINGLTKRFGQVVAVDNLSLAIPRGSVFGFLGANGAGKTTTIRVIAGLSRPSAGSVTCRGSLPRRECNIVGSSAISLKSPRSTAG